MGISRRRYNQASMRSEKGMGKLEEGLELVKEAGKNALFEKFRVRFPQMKSVVEYFLAFQKSGAADFPEWCEKQGLLDD